MQYQLEFKLLGNYEITLNGRRIEQRMPRKTAALLIYLAHQQRVHSRDQILHLLWGDQLVSGSTNLRVALTKLRAIVGECLESTRQSVSLAPDCHVWADVLVLEQAIVDNLQQIAPHTVISPEVETALRTGLALYHGPFLDEFGLPYAPAFMAWVEEERNRAAQLMRLAYRSLTENCLFNGRLADGIALGERWLAFDPCDQAAVRSLMRLYYRADQDELVRAVFEGLQARMEANGTDEPELETRELYATMASQRGLQPGTTGGAFHAPHPRWRSAPHNVPASLYPLIGRGGVGVS
ncbi:MAG: winged helix-turn-helix domain-containing protein [Anaerolineales bacterium]|nr:winged helix-turn-helix domain-containing protein [Anaerolineales bacterium]